MRFTLTIDCDNDAFGFDQLAPEVASLLKYAAARVASGRIAGHLADENGNTVGRFGFEDGPETK